MRQGTLSFFVVPKAQGEKERNRIEDESDAEEEMELERKCSDEESDGDESDERDLARAPPPEPESGPRRHFGTWSIPLHLRSRQTGAPRHARSAARATATPTATAIPTSANANGATETRAPSPPLVFSTPARHRAAAASAAARSLCPAKVSLPLVFESVVAEEAFPSAAAGGAAATTAATAGSSSSPLQRQVRRRRSDWSVTDLRFDDRTGELLAVALSGPAGSSGGGLEGELQLFSDTSVRSSLSLSSSFRRRRSSDDVDEDEGDEFEDRGEQGEEARQEEGSESDEEDALSLAKRHKTSSSSEPAELSPLATARFPGGPLLELAWDCCSSGSSDVVAALVGAAPSPYPSGALALFDLDDERVFSCPASSSSSPSSNQRRRHATAVIEPNAASSSSSTSLAFQQRFAAAPAPPWTSLCPSTVRGCFTVGDASGKVHLWDRRASLASSVGTLSCGRGSGSGGGFSVDVDASSAVASSSSSSSSLLPPSVRSLALLADGQTLVAGCSDGSLRLWDVRSCLGGGGGGAATAARSTAAGVVSLGGGAVAAFARRGPSSSSATSAAAALSVGGALPAARGCLRSAVRAVPGVEAVVSGTPELDFSDAVALGGVARVSAHPTDAARVAFRLDCGWNGAYVFGERDGGKGKEGEGGGERGGDGVGAVTHLHAPPVEATAAAAASSNSSSSTSRLRLRSAAWGPCSNLVVAGAASCPATSRQLPTLAVVDCRNAGSAAAVVVASGEKSDEKGERPFPAAVHVPVPSERTATAVAVHGSSGEVVVGTGDGCLAWFDGGCL